jgi:hypothetical protein
MTNWSQNPTEHIRRESLGNFRLGSKVGVLSPPEDARIEFKKQQSNLLSLTAKQSTAKKARCPRHPTP